MVELLALGFLSTLLVPPSLVCLASLIDDPLSFKLNGATNLSYNEFLEDYRGRLIGYPAQNKFESIMPVLRQPSAVKPNERVISVHLYNFKEEKLTLGIDVVDVYVLGYVKADTFYYFSDCKEKLEFICERFPETQPKPLPFNSKYGNLVNRTLGSAALDAGISRILHDDPEKSQLAVHKALLCVVQMISEAARFRDIGNAIGEVIETGESLRPSLRWIGLYKSWSKFSKAIETAVINEDIEFRNPIEIYDINGKSKISIPDLPTAMEEIKFGLLLNKFEEIIDNGDSTLIDVKNESGKGNGNTERKGRGKNKGKGTGKGTFRK